MKKLLTIILALLPILAFSQIKYDSVRVVKPQNFVEALSIDTAIVQIISQKAGVNRRVNFQTVADWILAQQPNLDSAQYANDTLLLFYGPDTILAVIPSGTIDTAYLSGDTLGIIFAGDTTEVVLVGLGDGNGIFDATNDGDTTAIGSVVLGEDLTVELNNHDWLFDGLVEDDTTSRIMTLRVDGSLAYRWLDSLLNGYTTGSGTPGTLPIWTGANAMGNSSLTESGGNVLATSFTGALKLPAGTDAQDPVWAAGMLRYNTTANGLQGYDGTAERYLPWASSPTSASGSILYSDGSKLIPSTVLTNRSNEIGIGQWSSSDRGSYSAQIVGSFYIGHYSSPSMTFSGGGQVLSSSFTTQIVANSPASGAIYARNTNASNGTMSAHFDAANSGYGVWSQIRSSSVGQPAYTASFQNGVSTMIMLRGTTKNAPSHCCGENAMNKVWRLVETQGYRAGLGYVLNNQSPIMHRIELGEASSPSDVDSYIRFQIRKDSVFSEFMRITGGDGSGIGTSVGGVGILTSAPTANLDINGNTRIRTMPDSIATYITMADASGYIYRATPGDVVAAGSGSTNSIYNLLPTQDILIDPNANDLIIGSFSAGNSGDFEFFTTNEDGQYAGIFAGTRDSSWLATGEGFQFDAALFSTGAEDGIMGVNYNYFGTVWNAATFGDSVLFAPYPGSELTMTINGLPDDPVNPYKVMVQDTVTDRVYLTSIDSLLGSETAGTISTSTDGSGDIVVAHGMGVTPTSVQVTVTGTTPYVVTVHTIGSTNFTVRFYDMTGAAVASTAVTATWHAKT